MSADLRLNKEQKTIISSKIVHTKNGDIPLEDFLLSVNSGSNVDSHAYFSMVGIIKELLMS